MDFVRDIKIGHFKSLENVEITGCRQFNLFVGRPNVGKSNILEALSLFSIPYIGMSRVPLTELVRGVEMPSLFCNGDVSRPVEVLVDGSRYGLRIEYVGADALDLRLTEWETTREYRITGSGIEQRPEEMPVFKCYRYDKLLLSRSVNLPFLFPLSGDNLMNVVQRSEVLKQELSTILKDYGLGLTFDTATQELKFIKDLGHGTSFIVPFVAIADTLKRLIFYKAAVYSNSDSVLLFEEPEAHSYPPYIVNVVNSVMASKDNQFFITTHSPYVVNEFLEQRADVAVFVVDYRDGRTVVRALTEEELQRVYDDGIDMFFNTELFMEG